MTAPMTAHLPVLLNEAIEALDVRPDGVYLDATFGRGGHSRAILARLGPRGRLIALDRDPQAVAEAQRIGDARFSISHAAFSRLGEVLDGLQAGALHGALFDLGVSSPQLDEAARGFSFRADGPLDMRMDPTRGESAAEWLARANESDIREVIKDYGEERFAKQIATAIVAARATQPLGRTRQLADLVGEAVRTREAGQDPATRTFQALRIFVNRELEEVSLSLPQAAARLAPGGRLAVIAFHSLEDRIVKRFMRAASSTDLPRGLPLREAELPQAPLALVGRAQRPGDAETADNPRARSATLRVAERTAAPLGERELRDIARRLGARPWRS
ncbi:MAG: 16S rRNA (cytosine(1402)-N(4))-methyltransferase RsmH [Betaproteobacteria bacterium]|nr:16S rRNA (cytosine(1402)-N(4))-methyltransferase RsmH [Betaproteobacteria bacterium]